MNILKHRYLFFSILLFIFIYVSISIVNHYVFRTYALDLGAYTNALYDYSHFQFNDSTVFKNSAENLLADHFDLYLILISPLSLIFKGYTLLIIQIIMIPIGGIGIYKLFNQSKIGLFACIYFLSFFGVFSAISFDYHSNVIASCIIPWLFLHIKRQNIKVSVLLFLLILIAKENMALWTFFISAGLFIIYRKNTKIKRLSFIFMMFSVVYFYLVISVFMPYFSNTDSYHHFHYSSLGNTPFDALLYMISHPIQTIKTLFINHNFSINGDYVKLELHLFLIISGLPILLKKPAYLIMLIPIYFQKLFHDNIEMWGIHNHYSVEFAPILAIGIFSVLKDIKKEKLRHILIYLVILFNIICTIRLMDNTVYFSNKSKIRIYKKSHYTREYDIFKVHTALNHLPKDAIISSQSPFVPHLAYRDKIYQFPIIKDAQYIILSDFESSYPIDSLEFKHKKNELLNSNQWKIEYDKEGLLILKRS